MKNAPGVRISNWAAELNNAQIQCTFFHFQSTVVLSTFKCKRSLMADLCVDAANDAYVSLQIYLILKQIGEGAGLVFNDDFLESCSNTVRWRPSSLQGSGSRVAEHYRGRLYPSTRCKTEAGREGDGGDIPPEGEVAIDDGTSTIVQVPSGNGGGRSGRGRGGCPADGYER